jgi:hypothetical protein
MPAGGLVTLQDCKAGVTATVSAFVPSDRGAHEQIHMP